MVSLISTDSPCLNDGSCSLVDGVQYVCACKIPFRGTLCEERYDACAGQVTYCLNGGECYFHMDAIHTPLCNCLEGNESILIK